ncbi:tripartite tricarboxylate transporter TctB family protein [Salibacterium aidingense]|uniref:tripartite tricarboxylate transporter TctB family protein n=1 Tax=Salibacterium aidingense TaxID=384933 RepID=UPI003BC72451
MKIYFNNSTMIGILLVTASVIYIYAAMQLPGGANSLGPSFLPILVGCLLIICSVIFLINEHIENKKQASSGENESSPIIDKKHFLLVIYLVIYLLVLRHFGFLLTSIPLLFFINRLYGMKGMIKPLLVAVFLPIIIYFLFQSLLGVPLNLI